MLLFEETYDLILSNPPYFLNFYYIALVNIAGAIGSLITWLILGKLIV
jgi:hypothetical protein